MKYAKPLLPLVLGLLFLITGCSHGLTAEDLVHIDIKYQDTLVTSYSDITDFGTIIGLLSEENKTEPPEAYDLSYTMEVRTYDQLMSYQLVFNRQAEEAAALGIDGSYRIPYEWLDTYLTALPIPEAFPQYLPPALTIDIDGYRTVPGYDQAWKIWPTAATSYDIEDHNIFSENYKTESLDLTIKGKIKYRQPDRMTLDIIGIESTDHYDSVNLSALPTPEKHGVYRYELTGYWDHPEQGFSGEIIYHFGVSVALPETYTLNGDTFQPGDCIAVKIGNPDGLDYTVKADTYDKTIGIYYSGQDLVGLIPLDPRLATGSHTVEITQTSTGVTLASLPYEIIYKQFDEQHLTVTGSTANLKSDDNRAKDAEKYKNAKSYSVSEQLWEGAFLQPVEGRISTEYAVKRYTNGSLTNYRHSGIDIAAPQGTPIKATNNGIVTFASDLIISGNVITLDHGYGIFSSYVHLYKIYVEEGDVVKKGDIIGEVGTTGFSTGPHLHWSISKGDVFLNPWKFIEEDPLAAFE